LGSAVDTTGCLDANDVFCLIGTDSKDYGVSKVAVGPTSDGLGRIEHAYVRNANRAFVFKSHSGSYGEVNSEEGYQNLQRFLFGRWQVRVDLAGLPTYAKVEEAQPPAVWQADMRLSVRGLSVVLSEQRADQYTPIQLNAELQQRKDSPDHPVPLLTKFLFDQTTASETTPTPDGQDAVRHQRRVRYSLTLRVAKLTQHDHSLDFSEHVEQVPDWADTAIFDVGPNATGDGLAAWAAWNSEVEGANDQKDPITPDSCQLTRTDDRWQFQLPLPAAARALPILGDNATLLVTVTDRDQPAAQDRGAELAQAGVRGQRADGSSVPPRSPATTATAYRIIAVIGTGPIWGPLGDHTLCAIVNDLRVYERLTRAHVGRTLEVTRGNVLPRFTGGQVVAGSILSARHCQPDRLKDRSDAVSVRSGTASLVSTAGPYANAYANQTATRLFRAVTVNSKGRNSAVYSALGLDTYL
jgi:hypothetical protein